MRVVKTFLLLFLFVLEVTAQNKQTEVDQYLAAKFKPTEPGVSVLIVKDGIPFLKKGYGMANLEKQESITPQTIFRIGSVTKQFTSTAILKLAQEKKIDLNDDIKKYLPAFNTAGFTITIKNLLNHTSGIKSYTSLPEIMSKEAKAKEVSVKDMLKIIESQPHDFAPGDQYLYNNSAYFMLGAIIEKVSKMSYQEYVIKNFFTPLKMTASFISDEKLPATAAIGYLKSNATSYAVADYVHPSIPYSAGAIFSTTDDLWKWNQALFSGRVIKQEWLDKAWAPTQLNNRFLESYGFGWQLGRLGENKVIGHGGAIDGFLSFEMYIPQQDLYICLLENSSTIAPEGLAYEIANMIIGGEKPAAIVLDETALDEYTGVYQVNATESRYVRREGTKMYSQRGGGTKFEIYPYAKDEFVFKETPTTAKFIRDGNGKVVAMEVIGREWVVLQSTKTTRPLPPELVEIEIDPKSFDVFIGEYELAPGFTINVWRDDNKFKAQATGQQPFEIYPKSENEFFLKVVTAQIIFNKDDSGKVNSLTLYQSGRELLGKKIK